MESSLSSPSRISNRGSPRKTFPGDHGNTDVGFDHFSGQTKSLEGELGVRNWSGTSRKENAPVLHLSMKNQGKSVDIMMMKLRKIMLVRRFLPSKF